MTVDVLHSHHSIDDLFLDPDRRRGGHVEFIILLPIHGHHCPADGGLNNVVPCLQLKHLNLCLVCCLEVAGNDTLSPHEATKNERIRW